MQQIVGVVAAIIALALMGFLMLPVFLSFLLIVSGLLAIAAIPTIIFAKAGGFHKLFSIDDGILSIQAILVLSVLITALVGLASFGYSAHLLTYREIAQPLQLKNNFRFDIHQHAWMYILMHGSPGMSQFIWSLGTAGIFQFFFATLALLATQNAQAVAKSSRANAVMRVGVAVCISLIGAIAYGLVMYGDVLVGILQSRGVSAAVLGIIEHIKDEIYSFWQLISILLGQTKAQSIWSWTSEELIKTNGSLYKVGSLYPKMFFVFLIFNLASAIKPD